MKSPEPTASTAKSHAVRYRNIHGRRAGRGLRPILIVLKLLCVSVFIGGLVVVLAGFVLAPQTRDAQAWREQAALLSRYYAYAIVPGISGALVCGTLLAASFLRVIIQMRWFQVKIFVVAVAMPALHLYLRSRSGDLRDVLAQSSPDIGRVAAIHSQIVDGMLVALGVAVVVLVLGRLKPRLGQDYGKTFSRPAD